MSSISSSNSYTTNLFSNMRSPDLDKFIEQQKHENKRLQSAIAEMKKPFESLKKEKIATISELSKTQISHRQLCRRVKMLQSNEDHGKTQQGLNETRHSINQLYHRLQSINRGLQRLAKLPQRQAELSSMTAEQKIVQQNLELATQEKQRQTDEMAHIYGKRLLEYIDPLQLYSLPVIPAKELNLESVGEVPNCRVKPSMLKGHSAVRGFLKCEGIELPFIAMKVDIKDEIYDGIKWIPRTRTVVEMIIKYTARTDGFSGQSYFTAQKNITEDGTEIGSYIHGTGLITPDEYKIVQDLFERKTVTILSNSIQMVMVK